MKKILVSVLALTILMAACLSGCGLAKAENPTPAAELLIQRKKLRLTIGSA